MSRMDQTIFPLKSNAEKDVPRGAFFLVENEHMFSFGCV